MPLRCRVDRSGSIALLRSTGCGSCPGPPSARPGPRKGDRREHSTGSVRPGPRQSARRSHAIRHGAAFPLPGASGGDPDRWRGPDRAAGPGLGRSGQHRAGVQLGPGIPVPVGWLRARAGTVSGAGGTARYQFLASHCARRRGGDRRVGRGRICAGLRPDRHRSDHDRAGNPSADTSRQPVAGGSLRATHHGRRGGWGVPPDRGDRGLPQHQGRSPRADLADPHRRRRAAVHVGAAAAAPHKLAGISAKGEHATSQTTLRLDHVPSLRPAGHRR